MRRARDQRTTRFLCEDMDFLRHKNERMPQVTNRDDKIRSLEMNDGRMVLSFPQSIGKIEVEKENRKIVGHDMYDGRLLSFHIEYRWGHYIWDEMELGQTIKMTIPACAFWRDNNDACWEYCRKRERPIPYRAFTHLWGYKEAEVMRIHNTWMNNKGIVDGAPVESGEDSNDNMDSDESEKTTEIWSYYKWKDELPFNVCEMAERIREHPEMQMMWREDWFKYWDHEWNHETGRKFYRYQQEAESTGVC